MTLVRAPTSREYTTVRCALQLVELLTEDCHGLVELVLEALCVVARVGGLGQDAEFADRGIVAFRADVHADVVSILAMNGRHRVRCRQWHVHRHRAELHEADGVVPCITRAWSSGLVLSSRANTQRAKRVWHTQKSCWSK